MSDWLPPYRPRYVTRFDALALIQRHVGWLASIEAVLSASCQADTDLKHDAGWHITYDSASGSVEWTSPSGRRYCNLTTEQPDAPHQPD
jgi:hypothetical protein